MGVKNVYLFIINLIIVSYRVLSCYRVRVVFTHYLIVLIVSDPLRPRPIKGGLRPANFESCLCRV